MAMPETVALSLPAGIALGPESAFIDDSEFCHLHALPESSLHLTLPPGLRGHAIEAGWAEPHPGGRAGFLAETLVMLYAPRNFEELDVVQFLLAASYRFACGTLVETPQSFGK